MNNPKTYQVLSVLGFIVSAVFTVKLFASNSTDLISWLAMVVTALLYECGKYILLYQGLKGPFGSTGKTVMLGCWLLVTTASIVASATYVLNDANANKNDMIANSSAFKKQENSIKVQNDLYATTKQQIDDLKALQGKQQQEGQAIVNAMPSNYTDRKNAQRAATQILTQKTQEQINQANDKLLGIAQGINKPEKLVIEEESTSGGDSFFKLVAIKLNENQKAKDKPYSTEQVGIFFYIMVGFGLECLANLFAFLSQYYKYSGVVAEQTQIKTEPPKTIKIESGRLQGLELKSNTPQIGFHKDVDKTPEVCVKSKVEDIDYTDEDVDNYRKVMYQTKYDSGNAKGFRDIGGKIGLSPKVAEKIHGHLCTTGEVEVIGTRTRILREVI